MKNKLVTGFSKLSKKEKTTWLSDNLGINTATLDKLKDFQCHDQKTQDIIDGFSENTIANFYLPYGLSPNFLIDGEVYCVPMAIEESSVVAAASAAAKYWSERGGFRTTILGTTKVGQVHFSWNGEYQKLIANFENIKTTLLGSVGEITYNMNKRGGGIKDIELISLAKVGSNIYQLRVTFETCDSMGANFINTVLEQFAQTLEDYFMQHDTFNDDEKDINIIMSILSNYTPECLVRVEVSCPIDEIGTFSNGMMAEQLVEKFKLAVQIAKEDVYRATTHNKGIFNGIDAVILATGNDFRATEAAGHAYAARDGRYRSLSNCEITDGVFRFWMDIPLAIGTVGGLTSLHPLAKLSLEILGNPDAKKLMSIIASVGLAQNFAAVRSLITTGIQQGHMKMHLLNILNHLGANDEQKEEAISYFQNQTISFAAVRTFLSIEV